MADNDLKNIKISQEDVRKAFDQWVKEQADQGYSAENIKYNIEHGQQQVNDILIKKAKAISLDKYYQQAVNKMGDALVKQVSDIKNQGKWERLTNFLARDGGGSDKDSFEQMYRVRQRFAGLEQLFSGNISSGLSQFFGTFKSINRIMGGPYFLAIQAVTTSLIKLDSALAKATKSAVSLNGALNSDLINQGYFNRGGNSLSFITDLRSSLYKIGMQSEYDNIINSLNKGYGISSYIGNQKNFVETIGYSQRGLGSYGIDSNSTNNLVSNLRLLEGKTQQGVYAQLQRLTERFNKMSLLSPEQALQQATSLYDQTKHLGTNFEWASKAIQKFEVGLKNGTISLNDFAAVNRALRGGGISKNAGIAAMVTDYASRAGINLPSEFLNSNAIGQGFGISTRGMLRNNKFAQAYQGTIQEQLDQMGGATKLEKAGMLQYLLGQYGVNISPEMAESAIKSNGKIDLIGSNIIGSGAFIKESKEAEQAKIYKEHTEKYYTATTSWHEGVLTKLGDIANNTKGGFGRGLSGENLSTDNFNIAEFAGIFTKSLFTQEYWENVGISIARAIPGVGLFVKPPNQ